MPQPRPHSFPWWFLREVAATMLLLACGSCVGVRAFGDGSVLVGMLGVVLLLAWIVLIVSIPNPGYPSRKARR